MLRRTFYVASAALFVASLLAPSAALACGGLFCDTGPQTMPVDQTGENILYAVDKEASSVEAHINIQYKGEAPRFAWVLPVQSLPTFDVGSQPLFNALLQGTVPAYGFSNQQACSLGAGGSSNAFGGGPDPFGGGGEAGSGGSSGGGPKVVLKKQVGAFDVTVLQGGTAAEVVGWLNDNGYQQNPLAEPILQKYLEKNYLFAAVKLTGGAGVDEIHPLVVKYHGTEPCIPLELTAIAAKENMGVRAFLLGDTRWAPGGNYKHIVLNPARFDWPAQATNYLDVLTRGADSAVADGRAFVTEYAGISSVVSTAGVFSASWSSKPFSTMQPEQVVGQLSSQGLMNCEGPVGSGGFGGSGGVFLPEDPLSCAYAHPLLHPLLAEFLPVPAGMSEVDFYGCLSCNKEKIDAAKWDGKKFAALFDERIVNPGKRGVELLQKWPYLTRLFTTISPAEMTSDPEFHPVANLPEVPSSNIATQKFECKHTVMQLPLPPSETNIRNIALPQGGGWVPWTDEMPWVERIEELPADGEPIVLVNNTQKIDDLIDAWNKSQGWPPGGAAGNGSAGTSTGGTGSSEGGAAGSPAAGGNPAQGGKPQGNAGKTGAGNASGAGTAGAGNAGGVAGAGTGGAGGAGGVGGSGSAGSNSAEPEGGGCSLGAEPARGGGVFWLAALGGLVLSRRRRATVR